MALLNLKSISNYAAKLRILSFSISSNAAKFEICPLCISSLKSCLSVLKIPLLSG
jgi:hypothetical protein